MGDLGLPGSVVEMPDEAPQKALWEVRKAGLNIMMSLKGDGKPVCFIEDCAVPLEHLADYTDALTEVFARHGTRGTWYAHASVGTLHVRPILDMRRDGAAKMRAIAEEAARAGAQVQGRLQRRARRRPVPRRMDRAGSSARGSTRRFRAIKHAPRSRRPAQPGQDRRPAEDGRRVAVPLCAGLPRRSRSKPALDWSAWNVQNDPVTEAISAPGTGGDPHRRLRQGGRDVQQQRPLPQVRRRHDVPELSRHARRAAPHARPRQHAAPGAVGPARAPTRCAGDAVREALDLCVGCKGCKRDCPTGVDMARMKIEVARAAAQACTALDAAGSPDRRPAALGAVGAPPAVAARTCATARPAARAWRALARACRRGARCRRGGATPSARRADARRSRDARRRRTPPAQGGGAVRRHLQRLLRARERASPRCACCRPPATRVHVGARRERRRPLCCGRTYLAAGMVDEARAEARRAARRAAAVRRARHRHRRPRAVVPADAARRDPGAWASATTRAHGRRAGAAVRGVPRARSARRPLRAAAAARPSSRSLVHGHCHQKAFGAVPTVLDGAAPDPRRCRRR